LLATMAIAGALLGAGQARASVLFQSIPDLYANPDQNAWCSSCGGDWQVFDTFTLATASHVGNIQFAVDTAYVWPTDVTISVWTSSGGLPGTQLWSQTFNTPISSTPSAFMTAVASVNATGLSLAAGTYEISFYNPVNLGIPGYLGGSGNLVQADPSGGF